jgi:hypothetical protein
MGFTLFKPKTKVFYRDRRDRAKSRLEEMRRNKEAKQTKEEIERRKQEVELERQKAQLERQKTERKMQVQKRPSIIRTVGHEAIGAIKTMKRKGKRQRAVYMSTSHGLKKVQVDEQGYPIQQKNKPYPQSYDRPLVEPRAPRIIDDEWGSQPSAFSGL